MGKRSDFDSEGYDGVSDMFIHCNVTGRDVHEALKQWMLGAIDYHTANPEAA